MKKFTVKKVALLLACVLALTMVSYSLPQEVSAASSSELKELLEEQKAQNAENEAKLQELYQKYNENASQMEEVIQQKNIIDQEIFLLNEQINNTTDQIATISLMIADKQTELDAAQTRLQTLNEQNKSRIRAMEEEGVLSYWSVLFKATSFSDLLDRMNMVQEIAAADQRRLASIREAAQAVAEAQGELELQKSNLEESRAALEQTQAELADARTKADDLLTQLIGFGEEYEKYIEDGEALQQELMEQMAQTEKDIDMAEYREWLATSVPETTKAPATSTPSSKDDDDDGDSGSSSSSAWRSPLLRSSYVTSPYGWREVHPVYGDRRFHHGVDLYSFQGDEIVAARSGVVTVASYQEGGAGNYVTINHGDGYSSTYMHMTHYIVSYGQYVTAGQVIGYVGSTGGSTGPHLHFGIFYQGESVNPVYYVDFS